VIVPDQVGWGKSSKPDMAYTFDLLANNTAKLLDTVKADKAIVLGHSTGGMLAVKFATMFPARVEKVILEGPLGMEDYTKHFEAPNAETLYAGELKASDEKQIRDTYAAYFADPKAKQVDALAEIPTRVRLSGEYPRWAKASALQYQMIHEQPVRSSYASLPMPVLIVVGDKDKTVPLSAYVPAEQRQGLGDYPRLAKNAAGEMPNAKAVVIEDCGHIPHLEKPSQFHSTVLNFAKEGSTVTKTE
jgi:pimeloyl-ACP methyl ester carboxylesterase